MLIPGDRNTPDPSVLSLEEMTLNIGIDNGTARVSIREIFANHTNRNLEGTYTFALPIRALLSDFAVWDDLTRIPGVILERKRAEEIYDNLRAKTIDPGLLQMGERSADEASRSSEFTAKVTPIPSRGTKRVEIEYNERIPVEQLSSVLSVPLKPDAYQAQIAGQLDININVVSDRPVKTFEALAKAYPLKISEQSPNRIRASFSGTKVALTEDFGVKYSFDPATADSLRLLTYRNPAETPATGFFQVSGLFGLGNNCIPAGQMRRARLHEPSFWFSTHRCRCSGTNSTAAFRRSRCRFIRCGPRIDLTSLFSIPTCSSSQIRFSRPPPTRSNELWLL